jgi:hypothetical protein
MSMPPTPSCDRQSVASAHGSPISRPGGGAGASSRSQRPAQALQRVPAPQLASSHAIGTTWQIAEVDEQWRPLSQASAPNPQQACPAAPQGSQLPGKEVEPTQRVLGAVQAKRFASAVVLLQQGWPAAPQAPQLAGVAGSEPHLAGVSTAHSSPAATHRPKTQQPLAAHLFSAQHGSPTAPHARQVTELAPGATAQTVPGSRQ